MCSGAICTRSFAVDMISCFAISRFCYNKGSTRKCYCKIILYIMYKICDFLYEMRGLKGKMEDENGGYKEF